MEATEQFKSDYEQLKKDIAGLKDEMKTLLESATKMGVEKSKAALETADETIKERPVTSIAVAFGAGCVLGLLISK